MMKISSINRTAKAFVLCAMLASSTPLIATNPIKTAKTKIMPQTEVVSRQGAEALKAIVYPQQKQGSAVPTVHNEQLDEKCLKFCDNEEEKTHMNKFLSMNYNKYGSYLGSAIIQQNIDLNMFLEFLDGNIEILKKFDEAAYNKIDRDVMQKVVEKNGPIIEWLNKNYFSAYKKPLGEFDHPPEAEEVSQALDKYVKSDPNNLFNKDLVDVNYTMQNVRFKRAQQKVNYYNTVQKNADYISNQIFLADMLLFYNLLTSAGFNTDDLSKVDKNLAVYLHEIRPSL